MNWKFWQRGRDEHSLISDTFATQTLWTDAKALAKIHDFQSFGNDGYRLNTLVRACINEIATTVAQPKFVVEQKADGDEWAPVGRGHALARLLRDPNPTETQYDFLESVVTDLMTFGNAFIHKHRNAMGRVVQMTTLRPWSIKLKLNPKTKKISYVVTKPQSSDVQASVGGMVYELPFEDVSHMRLPDPMNEFWGLAPIVSCLRAADMEDRALDYLRAFFANAGTPQGLLKLKARTKDNERQRIREGWKDTYSGASGWHTLAVIDADAEYQELGARPDKLKLDQVFDATETRICAAWGVPPIIVGARIGIMKSTFANYSNARRSFWEETLVPLYARTDQRLTKDIAREFGANLRIRADLSHIAELQEAMESRREFARLGWENGTITRNEAREMVNLPPLKAEVGDVLRVKNTEAGTLPKEGGEVKPTPTENLPEKNSLKDTNPPVTGGESSLELVENKQ